MSTFRPGYIHVLARVLSTSDYVLVQILEISSETRTELSVRHQDNVGIGIGIGIGTMVPGPRLGGGRIPGYPGYLKKRTLHLMMNR